MENNYEELHDKLAAKEIDELHIKREEFMAFRDVWIKSEDRKHIRGEAHLGGNVTYRWSDEEM